MRSDFDYTQSRCTRGSFISCCHMYGNSATMLAFFPNQLGPRDRVVSNLRDGFLLGAMATSRVAAPGVVTTA
jgi:hypothetical protein